MVQLRKEFTIRNQLGLHLRAASRLVQTASRFSSSVHIEVRENRVNGKSIIGLATLAAAKGTTIVVEAQGVDEEEAIEAIGRLIEDGFGED